MMGMDKHATDAWRFGRVRELADKLNSPHAHRVYVAKEYTKADLRRDLLAAIEPTGLGSPSNGKGHCYTVAAYPSEKPE